jgi:hypothetical protein
LAAKPGDIVRLDRVEPVSTTGGATVEGLVAELDEPAANVTWIGSGTAADVGAARIDLPTYAALGVRAVVASALFDGDPVMT